jgi:hypothetical protein
MWWAVSISPTMNQADMKKRCCKCKRFKLTKWFNRDRSSRDGFYGWCKKCVSLYRSSPKGKAARSKYLASSKKKRRETAAKYEATLSGKLARKKSYANYRSSQKGKARQARFRQSVKGKVANATHKANRRARKMSANIRDFTKAQWVALQESFGHRCAYCSKRAKGHLT